MVSIRSIVLPILIGTVFGVCPPPAVRAQTASPGAASGRQAAGLLRRMAGTWDVRQRMWPGAGNAAMELPAAVARRRLVSGLYLEEVMEAARPSPKDAFTRTAYFNYNPVTHQYEYFSIDTRAPQMMNERGKASGTGNAAAELSLAGSRFVAPRWGKAVNAAFSYRLTVGAVEGNHQTVRLYLTPLAGKNRQEFRAFEYVYTRRS